MNDIELSLKQWGKELKDLHLPRWHELPDIELYMDQVITLIEKYLSPVISVKKHPLLTSSMVNNYVKLGLIPAPTKKRYNQKHLAFLVAITLLKQVLTIPEVKDGILFQVALAGSKEAYDLFCTEQEQAIKVVVSQALGEEPVAAFAEVIPTELFAVRGATLSFAAKLFAEKVVELEQQYLKKMEDRDE